MLVAKGTPLFPSLSLGALDASDSRLRELAPLEYTQPICVSREKKEVSTQYNPKNKFFLVLKSKNKKNKRNKGQI